MDESVKANRQDAYDLFHQGTLALADMEKTGIRIDTEYLDRTIGEVTAKISEAEIRIKDSKIWRNWKLRFGRKANLDSDKQLVPMLIAHAGYKPQEEDITEKGNVKSDETTLRKITHPFVEDYFTIKKLKKTVGTYLKGIRRETCNGRVHCSFNLAGGSDDSKKGGARSGRGSCSDPNLQNFPIRNKTQGKLIRTAIIPSEGNVGVEVDYKILEVRANCFYNKDRNLILDVTDQSRDMHRDLAMQLFMIDSKTYVKHSKYFKSTLRDCAKNKFTFPQFYGSVWFQCAPDIWDMMNKREFRMGESGELVRKHLMENGITKLGNCAAGEDPEAGTFGYHVKQIEKDLWHNRFPEYAQWRRNFYDEYLDRGYFDLLTGFRCSGYMRRNQVTNFPGQGTAFHCLLWDIIEINRILKDRRMKSRLVCQIHDSIIGDVRKKELQQFLDICWDVMTEKIRKYWRWINVPMVVEVDVFRNNWYEKAPWVNIGERWVAV